MKNILTLLFLPLFSMLYSQVDLSSVLEQEDLICKESARAEKLMEFSAYRNEFAYQTDIYYQRMNWDINPAEYYITGEITYHFKSLVPDLNYTLSLHDALPI